MSNPRTQRTIIAALTIVTALVHLWLFYGGMGRGQPNYLFLANGVGYLVLLGAFFMTQSYSAQVRNIVSYVFMAYTAVTIIAWVVMNGGRFQLPLSIVDKLVEILLIVTLWMHLRATQNSRQAVTA